MIKKTALSTSETTVKEDRCVRPYVRAGKE